MSREHDSHEQGEESPPDDFQDEPQNDPLTPGAQKPESEVLNEEGVNTE